MRSLMICTAHQVLLGDQMEKNVMGGACSAYEEGERWTEGFGRETWGKETTCKTQARMGG